MNNAQALRNWGPVIANAMWSDFLEFQDVTGLMSELDEFYVLPLVTRGSPHRVQTTIPVH